MYLGMDDTMLRSGHRLILSLKWVVGGCGGGVGAVLQPAEQKSASFALVWAQRIWISLIFIPRPGSHWGRFSGANWSGSPHCKLNTAAETLVWCTCKHWQEQKTSNTFDVSARVCVCVFFLRELMETSVALCFKVVSKQGKKKPLPAAMTKQETRRLRPCRPLFWRRNWCVCPFFFPCLGETTTTRAKNTILIKARFEDFK